MSLTMVIGAIEAAPLSDAVKKEAVQAVRAHAELSRLFRKALYAAPEENFPVEVAGHIMTDILIPVFEAHDVPFANGRNTERTIYQALSGQTPVEYEKVGQ